MISITVTSIEQRYSHSKCEVPVPYSVFVQLGDGEFLHVASREDLEQAVQLVKALKASWPQEYVVRDSEGNDVDLEE